MQNWLKSRLKHLQKEFGSKQIGFEEISKSLAEKFNDKDEKTMVTLSKLNEEGVIEVDLHPQDNRKKLYRLVDQQINKFANAEPTRADLEAMLKTVADLIRTKVDYSFILFILFYRMLCARWKKDYDRVYKESIEKYGLTEEEADQNAQTPTYHDFQLKKQYLWEELHKDVTNLTENLGMAVKDLAENNPAYKDVFENFDFQQFIGNRENQEILSQIFEEINLIPADKISPHLMGDAYEWWIRLFAPQKAKEGEVYTPREAITLMVEMAEPKSAESIYDPSLGSAGMLIAAHTYVEKNFGEEEAKKLFLFGQEANYKTKSIAKMNLYQHGIKNDKVEYGDTLLYPKFTEEGSLKKFDVVLANPPWNQDGYGEETIKKGDFWKERFNQHGFAPDQSADWMWIAHMWSSAKDESGRLGIVMDAGALFRGGKEKAIRQKFTKQNAIECIVLLPEKLFYNTPAAGVIIFMRKNKKADRKDKILFINASNTYIKHPEVRRLNSLSNENISQIVNAYKNFEEIEGFSRIVDLDEIIANEYNLNVTLYVFPEEEKKHIDIRKEWMALEKIDRELKDVDSKIANYLKELGY